MPLRFNWPSSQPHPRFWSAAALLLAVAFSAACDGTGTSPVAPSVADVSGDASGNPSALTDGAVRTAQARPLRQLLEERNMSGFSGTCTLQRAANGDLVLRLLVEGPPNTSFRFSLVGPLTSFNTPGLTNRRGVSRFRRRILAGLRWPEGMASCVLNSSDFIPLLLAETGDFNLP